MCMYIQGELKTLLSQHPPTATTLNAVKKLLCQQSLVFDVDLARWLVVLVTDLGLVGSVALTSAVEVVIMLTKLLLVSLSSSTSGMNAYTPISLPHSLIIASYFYIVPPLTVFAYSPSQ